MNNRTRSPKARIYRSDVHDTIITMHHLLEKIFKWGIAGTFFLVPLCYISTSISPFTTPKLFLFMGLTDGLIILWVWIMMIDSRYRPTRRMMLFLSPVILLLGTLTISSLMGADPSTSFLSTVESGIGLIFLYHTAVFACMTACTVRVSGFDMFKKIMKSVYFSGVILAVLTFFTDSVIDIHSFMLNHSTRGAMMGNVLFLGSYLIFTFFFGLILLVRESRLSNKIWYGLGLCIVFFSPVFFLPGHFADSARMAGISLVGGLGLSCLVWFILQRQKVLKYIGILGLIASVSVGIFLVYQISIPTSRLGQVFTHESGNRLSDWYEAVQGIKEKPILGWGVENYRLVAQKYLDPHVFDPGQGDEVWVMHPHNNSLEILVNGGVIGFIVYLGMITSIFVMIILLYRRKIITAEITALLMGMIVAYLVQDQMIFDTVTSYMVFLGLIGILIGLLHQSQDSKHIPATISSERWIIGSVVTIGMVIVCVLCVIVPMHKISRFYQMGNEESEGRTAEYQQVFMGTGSGIIQNQVSVYVDNVILSFTEHRQELLSDSTLSNSATVELATLGNVIDSIWQKRPFDYHLTFSLAQLQNLLFIINGHVDADGLARAKKYEEQGMKLSPTDPQIYAVYAQTLAFSGDISAAQVMVQKSLDLNPNYGFAKTLNRLLVGK